MIHRCHSARHHLYNICIWRVYDRGWSKLSLKIIYDWWAIIFIPFRALAFTSIFLSVCSCSRPFPFPFSFRLNESFEGPKYVLLRIISSDKIGVFLSLSLSLFYFVCWQLPIQCTHDLGKSEVELLVSETKAPSKAGQQRMLHEMKKLYRTYSRKWIPFEE